MTQPILSDLSNYTFETVNYTQQIISPQEVFDSILGNTKHHITMIIFVLFAAQFLVYGFKHWIEKINVTFEIKDEKIHLNEIIIFTLNTTSFACALILLNYAVQW